MQFRCFVGEGELLAISQREVSRSYTFLLSMRSEIRWRIDRFFEEKIRPRFDHSHYVFDIYITRAGRVRLVDFNTWGGATLPLLFTWDELGTSESLAFGQHKDHPQSRSANVAEPLLGASQGDGLREKTLPGSTSEGEDGEQDEVPLLRLVKSSEQVVRPGLRTSVPLDLVDPTEGGALDALYQRMREEAQEELADEAGAEAGDPA
eukprot:scaffold3970_cov417-Prasinococcus_capsulatus_cf.AAC.5